MDILCRVCFQLREPLIDICKENLSDLLEKCGGIKVEITDSHSKYLCKDCTSELLIAARFREKCERSKENLFKYHVSDKSSDFDFIIEESVDEDTLVEELNSSLIDIPLSSHIECKQEDEIEINALDEIALSSAEECCKDDTFLNAEESDNILQSTEFANTTQRTTGYTSERQIFECDVCGASFVQASNLRRHIEKSHKANELYACEICAHCFVSRDECERHCSNCNIEKHRTASVLQNSTVDSNGSDKKKKGKSHECSYCGKIMATPFALNAHIRIHTGECPFSCHECGKAFRTQASLSVHLKRHAGMPDFACRICGKQFYETSNLKVHMKTHTGEKPHRCKICNQSFARVFLLEIHTRIHTGEKPYKCDKCNRAFTQSCDLRYHIKTHTGERHYVCSICKKGFIKRNSLFLHMQRHNNSIATMAIDDASQE